MGNSRTQSRARTSFIQKFDCPAKGIPALFPNPGKGSKSRRIKPTKAEEGLQTFTSDFRLQTSDFVQNNSC